MDSPLHDRVDVFDATLGAFLLRHHRRSLREILRRAGSFGTHEQVAHCHETPRGGDALVVYLSDLYLHLALFGVTFARTAKDNVH